MFHSRGKPDSFRRVHAVWHNLRTGIVVVKHGGAAIGRILIVPCGLRGENGTPRTECVDRIQFFPIFIPQHVPFMRGRTCLAKYGRTIQWPAGTKYFWRHITP